MVENETVNYQCPNCMGPLHFDGASGKLKCDYCGSIFTVEEVRRYIDERRKEQEAESATAGSQSYQNMEGGMYGQQAAQGAAAAGSQSQQTAQSSAASEQQVTGQGTAHNSAASEQQEQEDIAAGGARENVENSDLHIEGWGRGSEKLHRYICKSCGAELIFDDTIAATSCPYCGNPTVIPDQFEIGRKPDLIIPFHYSKEQAKARLKDYYKGKALLPKAFLDENHMEEMKGVYVPFWMYNKTVSGDMSFNATRSETHIEGDFQVTRTQHFAVRRSGTVDFTRIPADASRSMPDDLMDSIEPYDYKDLKPFAMEYLPGYLANRYDVDEKEDQERTDTRACNSTAEVLRDSVNGYSTVTETGRNMQVQQRKTEYALLPVWLLHTKWQGKDFVFAMNGQTANMTGDLPISGGKLAAFFAGIGVLLSLLSCLIIYAAGYDSYAIGIVFAFIISAVVCGSLAAQMKPVHQKSSADRYIGGGAYGGAQGTVGGGRYGAEPGMSGGNGIRISVRQDQYINTTVTRIPIQRNEGGPGDHGYGPGGRGYGPGGPEGHGYGHGGPGGHGYGPGGHGRH